MSEKAHSPNQKLKLLYLYDIFMKQTDEQHPLTRNELIEKLKAVFSKKKEETPAE